MHKRFTLKARDTLLFWEAECEAGRAQGMPAKGALKTLIKLFDESEYEFCAHNAAILGSTRYKKYKIPGFDVMITKDEYKKLSRDGVRT